MRDVILETSEQFGYNPEILNSEKLSRFEKFVIAGMGGSNLAIELLKIRDPYLDIIAHRNYSLPPLRAEELRERFLIANSYSGNTEETLDTFEEAVKRGFPAAAIATGGKLLELAKKHALPYVQIPATGIQPRSALGFQMKAMLKLMGREKLLSELSELSQTLRPEEYEEAGRNLAEKLKGHVPIIYSSDQNRGLAHNWKVKFNETGKIPAFYNIFPELNHNEMTGFEIRARENRDSTQNNAELERQKLNALFHLIFLKDSADHFQIQKRMEVTKKLYEKMGLVVEVLEISGSSVFDKIFSSLVLADWSAYYTAEVYGLEPEQVPMVEEFKRLIA